MDVTSEGLFLNQRRGFLIVSKEKDVIAEVPLDDIAVLILSAQGISMTKDALMSLVNRGSPIVLCGANYTPESLIIPLFGSYEFTGRLQIQLGCSIPLKKQLWRTIIQEKIKNQALILDCIGLHDVSRFLVSISKDVTSGDTTNRESYAAREYWSCIFGNDFSRLYDSEDGINVLLNYGYAVLRGMTARAVCSAGLLPSIGIHHKNKKNNYCLVDDLMEPFRPLVDIMVYDFLKKEQCVSGLSEWKKNVISNLPDMDVFTEKGRTPLVRALEYYAYSLFESYKCKENHLCIPTLLVEREIVRETEIETGRISRLHT